MQARSSSSYSASSSSVTRTQQSASSSSSSAEYEAQVQQARLMLKPICSERSAIMCGRRGGSASSSASAMMSARGGFGAAGFGVGAGFAFGGGSRSGRDSKLAFELESIVEKRQQQKAELVLLNERLADYVEKSRFLEAQNRRLVMESETVKVGFSSEAVNLKARYLLEIEEIKRLIEVSEVRRSELTIKLKTAEEQYSSVSTTLTTIESTANNNITVKERLYVQLGEMEGELSTLRRRVGDFDLERKRYTHIIAHLRDEESELRRDLEHERMVTLTARSTVQQLRDELEFITETHKTKMTEMTTLAYRDTTAENRAIWRSEFTEAFRALHADYMTRLDEVHMETESAFAVTVQQQQTTSSKDTFELSHFAMETQRTTEQITFLNTRIAELTMKVTQYESKYTQLTSEKTRITQEWSSTRTRLQTELDTYRTELVNTKQEIQTILDDKLSLEIEIASYKELLDSEEGRINANMDVALLEQGRYNAKLAQRSMLETQMSGMSSSGFGCSAGGSGGASGGYSSYSSSSYSSGGGASMSAGYGMGSSSMYSSSSMRM